MFNRNYLLQLSLDNLCEYVASRKDERSKSTSSKWCIEAAVIILCMVRKKLVSAQKPTTLLYYCINELAALRQALAGGGEVAFQRKGNERGCRSIE